MVYVRRRRFLIAAGALAVAQRSAAAQPAAKVPRVGILTAIALSSIAFPRQFPDALRELGYVEKQNILLEWRSADGRLDRLVELASELVHLKADVIVTINTSDTLVVRQATATVPIVMAASQDPVGAGLVASLSRPGGNITGRTFFAPETVGKQLHILKETDPSLKRVVYLSRPGVPGFAALAQAAKEGASALGLTLHMAELRPTEDVLQFLEDVRRWQPDALYMSPAGISAGQRDAILRFAVRHRLPTMSTTRGMVESGALMVYAPSTIEVAQRTAWYVDRILKGTKPSDLPVEQPLKYDLVINMKTARAIGLTIPQLILRRADAVIE